MSYWQGIRYLIWNDIRNARWKNLFVIVLVAYLTLFTYRELAAIVSDSTKEPYTFLIDYLILIMFSITGLTTTHLYGFGSKKDLLSERLAYWRSLPIKIEQIVWSRIAGVTIFSLLSLVAYYLFVGILMKIDSLNFELVPYMLHGLTVYAIIYVFNLIYLVIEMSCTYKQYMIYCWIIPFVKLLIVLCYTLIWKFFLLESLFYAVQRTPIIMAAASIILIAASCLLAFRIINERVRTRNILN